MNTRASIGCISQRNRSHSEHGQDSKQKGVKCMKAILILAISFLIVPSVFAEEVTHCIGTTYDYCRSIGNTSIWLENPNDYSTTKDGFIYMASGCQSLSAIEEQYRKCADTDADTKVDAVVEMSQAEKDAIDAPELAAEMERQAYATEIGSNSICDATLQQIGDVIDARRADFQTQINNAKTSIQTTIDATNNVASAKTAMTAMNNTYATGYGLLADDLVAVTKQIGRCLKARSALGSGI